MENNSAIQGFVLYHDEYFLNFRKGWVDFYNAHVWKRNEVIQIFEESVDWEFAPTHIQRARYDTGVITLVGEIRSL